MFANVHAALESDIEVALRQLAPQPHQLSPVVSKRVVASRLLGPSQTGIDELVDEAGAIEQGAGKIIGEQRGTRLRKDLSQLREERQCEDDIADILGLDD